MTKDKPLIEKIKALKNGDWCKVGTKDQQEGRKGAIDISLELFKEAVEGAEKDLKEELCKELLERGWDTPGLDRIPQQNIIKKINKIWKERFGELK